MSMTSAAENKNHGMHCLSCNISQFIGKHWIFSFEKV